MLFRAWSPWHVLRHNCGYKLANDGYDTRAIQHASTVRYTGWRRTGSREVLERLEHWRWPKSVGFCV
jgi:hypothetical protein